jgi:hypothetical protein
MPKAKTSRERQARPAQKLSTRIIFDGGKPVCLLVFKNKRLDHWYDLATGRRLQ